MSHNYYNFHIPHIIHIMYKKRMLLKAPEHEYSKENELHQQTNCPYVIE